jgi:hypothetical protein
MKTYKVYGASSYDPLHATTPANAYSLQVQADNPFAAMGEANKFGKRVGINFHDFAYIEVIEVKAQ